MPITKKIRYIIGPYINLSGENLEGYDLTGANLTSANLTSANLTGANLTGANLTDVILNNTILNGANITGANITGVDLSNYYITEDGYIFNLVDTEIVEYCKTSIQRNPLSGYKKINKLVSIEDCSKIPQNTVYTDNYAKHSANYNISGCIKYKQYNSTLQNKNGNINNSYNYSTKQYLTKRNKTYETNAFNFVKTLDQDQFLLKDSSCITYDKKLMNDDLFKIWRDKNQNNKQATHKPNNKRFSQQGAVSGGSRIHRLKYQTQIKAQHNNTINGEYPATRYYNGIPNNKKFSFGITKEICNIRKMNLFQRCNNKTYKK